jgi:hypothetical protein
MDCAEVSPLSGPTASRHPRHADGRDDEATAAMRELDGHGLEIV